MDHFEVNITNDDQGIVKQFDEAKPEYRSRSGMVRILMREYIEEHGNGKQDAERS